MNFSNGEQDFLKIYGHFKMLAGHILGPVEAKLF